MRLFDGGEFKSRQHSGERGLNRRPTAKQFELPPGRRKPQPHTTKPVDVLVEGLDLSKNRGDKYAS
jgi:hypothetical protein